MADAEPNQFLILRHCGGRVGHDFSELVTDERPRYFCIGLPCRRRLTGPSTIAFFSLSSTPPVVCGEAHLVLLFSMGGFVVLKTVSYIFVIVDTFVVSSG